MVAPPGGLTAGHSLSKPTPGEVRARLFNLTREVDWCAYFAADARGMIRTCALDRALLSHSRLR